MEGGDTVLNVSNAKDGERCRTEHPQATVVRLCSGSRQEGQRRGVKGEAK